MSRPPDDLYLFRFEFSIGAVDRRRQLVPYRAENEKDLADRSVSTLRWYICRWVVYGEPACAFFREKFEESYSCGACVLVCACMQIVVWNIMGNVAVKAVCFALRNIMKVRTRLWTLRACAYGHVAYIYLRHVQIRRYDVWREEDNVGILLH